MNPGKFNGNRKVSWNEVNTLMLWSEGTKPSEMECIFGFKAMGEWTVKILVEAAGKARQTIQTWYYGVIKRYTPEIYAIKGMS